MKSRREALQVKKSKKCAKCEEKVKVRNVQKNKKGKHKDWRQEDGK